MHKVTICDNVSSMVITTIFDPCLGWGSSSPLPQKADPGFIQFLEELQQEVMQEYTSGISNSKR